MVQIIKSDIIESVSSPTQLVQQRLSNLIQSMSVYKYLQIVLNLQFFTFNW